MPSLLLQRWHGTQPLTSALRIVALTSRYLEHLILCEHFPHLHVYDLSPAVAHLSQHLVTPKSNSLFDVCIICPCSALNISPGIYFMQCMFYIKSQPGLGSKAKCGCHILHLSRWPRIVPFSSHCSDMFRCVPLVLFDYRLSDCLSCLRVKVLFPQQHCTSMATLP